jgi:hypothetical protein
MRKTIGMVMVVLVVAGLLLVTQVSGETGHYPLGSEGIKGATLPPPGLYLKTYTSFYTANSLRDRSGKDDGSGLDLDALAIVPRLVYMTDHKILGADYGMDVLIPFVQTDLELDTYGVKFNDFCWGDLFVEPIDLAWHGDRYDIGAAFGVWMPTGKYNKNNPASPGKDFWTTMFTLGGTYYLDEEKSWSASILGRYEIHSYKDHTDVKPGQNVLFEWGVGKTIEKVWEVGVAGYAQWQLTDDKGSDVTYDAGVHDRVAAIGPEVTVFIPPAKVFLSLRTLFEFSAVDRPEGTTTTLTVIKIF